MAEESAKSCCSELKERYSKLEEGRNALRRAVKLLELQCDRLQTENLNISKALEEERTRVEAEKEAKLKESTTRVGLENEILNLKSEISSLRESSSSCADEERKKAMNEKSRADQLFKQLEEERRRNSELQKEMQKIMSAKQSEKVHGGHSEEAHRWPETKEQKAMNEKCHTDHLAEQLEKERQRNKQLEKAMQEIMSSRKMEKVHPVHFDSSIQAASADMMFLQKQLKLEKMHVKHAKRVAKLERAQKNLLQQEVCRLKQDLFQYSHRLKALDGCFSRSFEDQKLLMGPRYKLE